jgi:Na+/citrate or Na+/malate symporter
MSMKFQFVPVFIAGLMLGAILAEVKRDVSLIKYSTASINTIVRQVSTGP